MRATECGGQHCESALCLHLPKKPGRRRRRRKVQLLGVKRASEEPLGLVCCWEGVSVPRVWGSFAPPCPGHSFTCAGGCGEGRWGSGVGTMPWPTRSLWLGILPPLEQPGFLSHPGLAGVGGYGVAEPGEGRAGTGPVAEPKGKLKNLPAAGGDEKLFRTTATARQAGGASVCAVPGEVLCPGGGTRWHSRGGDVPRSGQTGVHDGVSGFARCDLWQQKGGGHGGGVGVPIVPCPLGTTGLCPCSTHQPSSGFSSSWQ